MTTKILSPLIAVLAVVGLAGAGTQLYAYGQAVGRDQVAQVDDNRDLVADANLAAAPMEPVLVAQADPAPAVGPAGAVLFDAGGPSATAAPAQAAPATAASSGAKPPPPPPADPLEEPGDAYSGFRLWLETYGWTYAILFAFGTALIAVSLRFQRLRKGKAAVLVGTGLAIVTAALAGKAAGFTDSQVVMVGMNLAMGGGMWLLRPSAATVDLSTATPEQIAEALAKAQGAAKVGG